jgi:histidine triad (HIT) family protein
MPDCIFCKIVKGELPATKTFEDEMVIAFLDIHPKGPGHTMLIPKVHYRWFEEMPDDLSDHLFRVAKQIAKNMKKETGADHVQLGIVGKDVPHVHIHLIPRQVGERAAGLA